MTAAQAPRNARRFTAGRCRWRAQAARAGRSRPADRRPRRPVARASAIPARAGAAASAAGPSRFPTRSPRTARGETRRRPISAYPPSSAGESTASLPPCNARAAARRSATRRTGQSVPISTTAFAVRSTRSHARSMRAPRSPRPCVCSVSEWRRASVAKTGWRACGAQCSSIRAKRACAASRNVSSIMRACSRAAPCSPSSGTSRVFTRPGCGRLREDDERGPFKPRSRSAARGLPAARRASRRAAAATSGGSCAARRGAPSAGRRSTARCGRQAGGEICFSRALSATSSISGMSGNPPAASNAARRTNIAWSPVAMPLRRERRSCRRRRPRAAASRPAMRTSKRPQRAPRKRSRATSGAASGGKPRIGMQEEERVAASQCAAPAFICARAAARRLRATRSASRGGERRRAVRAAAVDDDHFVPAPRAAAQARSSAATICCASSSAGTMIESLTSLRRSASSRSRGARSAPCCRRPASAGRVLGEQLRVLREVLLARAGCPGSRSKSSLNQLKIFETSSLPAAL